MSGVNAALADHLARGVTTVARCWAITRADGVVLGFTDHDTELSFEGITFAAASGMTASALVQGTGLAVDNAEAVGALSHDSLAEAEIAAGRFDNAGVRIWLVNWAETEARHLQFHGHIGELRRKGAVFEAELRGLSERLNQPRGQVYQGPCPAILGDARCGFDLTQSGFVTEIAAEQVEDRVRFVFSDLAGVDPGWFGHGRLEVASGAAAGLEGLIKKDVARGGARLIELWQELPAEVIAGDMLRLTAGCDKRAETCKGKFANFVNFRGFPHIPGDDWLMRYPTSSGANDGGSLHELLEVLEE